MDETLRAGALNIITKGPSDDFKLKIGVEAGDFSKRTGGLLH